MIIRLVTICSLTPAFVTTHIVMVMFVNAMSLVMSIDSIQM